MARTVALAVLSCLALPIYEVLADEQPAPPPAPEQWIAPLPEDLDLGGPFGAVWQEQRMPQWVLWPSDEYIAERQPLKDRSDPQAAKVARGKALPGTVSPREAAGEAYVRALELLGSDWIPKDLPARLVLLQEDDATKSSVMCRFMTNGTRFQMAIRVWATCVVIVPDPEVIKGLEPKDIGPAVFRRSFTEGERMATVAGTKIDDLPDGLYGLTGDGRDWLWGRWWGWPMWYTDGRAVAVYLSRGSGQFTFRPTNPWF